MCQSSTKRETIFSKISQSEIWVDIWNNFTNFVWDMMDLVTVNLVHTNTQICQNVLVTVCLLKEQIFTGTRNEFFLHKMLFHTSYFLDVGFKISNIQIYFSNCSAHSFYLHNFSIQLSYCKFWIYWMDVNTKLTISCHIVNLIFKPNL